MQDMLQAKSWSVYRVHSVTKQLGGLFFDLKMVKSTKRKRAISPAAVSVNLFTLLLLTAKSEKLKKGLFIVREGSDYPAA